MALVEDHNRTQRSGRDRTGCLPICLRLPVEAAEVAGAVFRTARAVLGHPVAGVLPVEEALGGTFTQQVVLVRHPEVEAHRAEVDRRIREVAVPRMGQAATAITTTTAVS